MVSHINALPLPQAPGPAASAPDLAAVAPATAPDQGPTARFTVERRTRGLVLSERLGCALATGVACIPPFLFGSWMLPLLKQENGFFLLVLAIALVLGVCASIFIGIAISVFAWWIPRLAYLSMNNKVRRTNVRAGVRSRGIWIAGIGWLPWSGLHIREKTERPGMGHHCTAIVIKTPQYGDMVLHSPENAAKLLSEIRQFMEYQPTEFANTEFQNTEILPQRSGETSAFQPSRHPPEPERNPAEHHAQECNAKESEFQATEIMAYDDSDGARTRW